MRVISRSPEKFGRMKPAQLIIAAAQMKFRPTIAGNVGSIVAFAVGEDSEWLASTMAKAPGQLQTADLGNLPRYTAMVRLLVDGSPTNPFSITTLPPPVIVEDRSEIVVQCSRRRNARPIIKAAAEIERELLL